MNQVYYKNLKKKIYFKKLEIIFKIYFYIFNRFNNIFKNYFKLNIYYINHYIYILKKLKIRQTCIITTRKRSSYKLCGLSRYRIKEYLNLGFIPNLKKLS